MKKTYETPKLLKGGKLSAVTALVLLSGNKQQG